MKVPRRHMPLWLRDLVTPRFVEYLLLLQQRSISFLRLVGSSRTDTIIRNSACGDDLTAALSFLANLLRHPQYYGQPFSILLHNNCCYSYLHILDARSGNRLAKNTRFLEDDDVRFTQEVRKTGDRRIFIAQGIRRTYLEGLLEITRTTCLPVVSISTLASQVGRMAPLPAKPSLHLLEFATADRAFLALDGRTGALYGELPIFALDDPTSESQIRALLPPDLDLETYSYTARSSRPEAKHPVRALAPLLANERQQGFLPRSAKRGRLLRRTLNVAKLLTVILTATAILGGLLAGSMHILARPGETLVEDYQREYSRQLRLTAIADSLQQEIARVQRALPQHRISAPWVTLFCQERLPRLHLNRLEIAHDTAGSVNLRALGAADRESMIFRYLELLKSRGTVWELHSIAPEVTVTEGRPDTVQSFTLRLERGQHAP